MLVLGSLILAWLLRFDFKLPYARLLSIGAVVLVLIRLLTLRIFNLHRGWWNYTGIADVVGVVKAVGFGSLIFVLITQTLPSFRGFPRSILILEPVLTIGLLAGVRLLSRIIAESVRVDLRSSRRVVLIGAGFAAQQILRELKRPDSEYVAIGCLDDNPSKRGIRIHGVPILGAVSELPQIVGEHAVDEALIAVPSATGAEMSRFIEICNSSSVKFRTVPALKDIIAGQVGVSQLREVSLEDLLGRDPVQIDLESVRQQIENRTVAVTGAAGSIGSELCRQILDYRPARLVCIDQSETGLFFLQLELSRHASGSPAVTCVADIGNTERVRHLFLEYKPTVVFHAAAYKHVPMMERNASEAVSNNVFVLLDLLDIAEEARCESFVLISSDKAVNPSSVMGATKRIGELIVSSRPTNGMRCVSVRFGNVLGSSGSVIPVLKQQLLNNQPLTITHPEVKRFFMMTREAIALVLQAFAIGNHGDILVLDMGSQISIVELARNLIRLSGKSEDLVRFEFTGLRDGEKFEEELFYHSENVFPTTATKIKRARGETKSWSQLQQQLKDLKLVLNVNGAAPIRNKLKEIVPEYYSDTEALRPDGKAGPIERVREAVGHK
ncbi:MAG: polysaccharide biosynthesis protein [Candidatus Acidiferrales bacterium]